MTTQTIMMPVNITADEIQKCAIKYINCDGNKYTDKDKSDMLVFIAGMYAMAKLINSKDELYIKIPS
jgi:hypothetical protein